MVIQARLRAAAVSTRAPITSPPARRRFAARARAKLRREGTRRMRAASAARRSAASAGVPPAPTEPRAARRSRSVPQLAATTKAPARRAAKAHPVASLGGAPAWKRRAPLTLPAGPSDASGATKRRSARYRHGLKYGILVGSAPQAAVRYFSASLCSVPSSFIAWMILSKVASLGEPLG